MKGMSKKPGRKIKYADKYTKGYQNQQGYGFQRHYNSGGPSFQRKHAATALKILLVVVIAVALIGLGYFLMSLWMNYRAAQPKEPAKTPETTQQTSGGTSEPETKPAPAVSNVAVRAIYVDESSLDNGAKLDGVIADAKKKNANTVVFELKRSDGTLAYESGLDIVKNTTKAVKNPASDVNGSLKKLKDNGLTPMARVYCFQDKTAPAADYTMGILYTGGKQAWLDASRSNGGKQWLNPYADSARAYLCDIIKEIAGLGIDQILLDGVQYPTASLNKTYFSEEVQNNPTADMLSQFIKEAKTAVAGKAKVYVAVNAGGTFSDTATAYRGNIMQSEADGFAPKLYSMGGSYKINGQTVYTSNRTKFVEQAAAYYKTAFSGKTFIPFIEDGSTSDAQIAALSQAGITTYVLYDQNGSY